MKISVVTDIELAGRIRAGDRAAWDEFYRRYLPPLWRFAFAKLRPQEAAARDAVSETFLSAMREITRFDPQKGSVAAWLMGIARHKIADARRARKLDELPDEAILICDPAGPAMLEETRIAVGRVMVDLGDDYRLALEWKYIDGLSVRDIANRIGRDEKATEALLYRAREEFRRRAGHLMDAKGATDVG